MTKASGSMIADAIRDLVKIRDIQMNRLSVLEKSHKTTPKAIGDVFNKLNRVQRAIDALLDK
jgi:hypothetical protein